MESAGRGQGAGMRKISGFLPAMTSHEVYAIRKKSTRQKVRALIWIFIL